MRTDGSVRSTAGGLAALVLLGPWAGAPMAATINIPADYASIQAGINAASDGDEVVIAPDTYYENINFRGKAITVRSTDPNDPDVVAATIIDGGEEGSVVTFADGEGLESVLGGLTITNGTGTFRGDSGAGGGIYCPGSSPTIRGNTISGNGASGYDGGYGGGIYCSGDSPRISGNTISHNRASSRWVGWGGGIYCSGSSPTVTGNTIADNGAWGYDGGYGGGIYCRGERARISGNIVTGNRASAEDDEAMGGGIYCGGSKPRVTDNTISGNWASAEPGASGGGIYCSGGSPTIAGNTISANGASGYYGGYGGGIYCNSSSPAIKGNTIRRNAATDGGGIYCGGGSPAVAGNTIKGNSARDGGGIYCSAGFSVIAGNAIYRNRARGNGSAVYCSGASPAISGNTISGNSTKADGAAVHCRHSSPTIKGSIIAFSDAGAGISAAGSSDPIVSYCDVYGNAGGDYVGFTPSGPGNISRDPLFANPASGDFHLESRRGRWDGLLGRWVRDAEYSPCIDAGDPASDYSQEAWPHGGRVNMGAYANTPEASKSRRLHLPELSWLGTAGYEADGVDPNRGAGGDTRFRFKVLYSDADGHEPRYVTLHLRRNGKPFWEFTMVRGVGDYTTGRVYRRTRKLPPGNYEHCFKARDRDGLATGEATQWTPGPVVGPRTSVALTNLCAVPTNSGAQITFSLSSAAQVQARVLNIAGRPVRTLCHAKDCEGGTNTLLWNAQSDTGLAVPNGTYLVELTAKAGEGEQARVIGQVRVSR